MDRTLEKRVYSCWIVVEPAEDMPGTWVSHCLNFDVVSYGDSVVDAVVSVCEAVEDVVIDDLSNGLDPLQRGSTTPSGCWERLKKIVEAGKPVKMSEVASGSKLYLAHQVNFVAEIETVKIPASRDAARAEPVSVSPFLMEMATFSASNELSCH